jgi:hypothetical protein
MRSDYLARPLLALLAIVSPIVAVHAIGKIRKCAEDNRRIEAAVAEARR